MKRDILVLLFVVAVLAQKESCDPAIEDCFIDSEVEFPRGKLLKASYYIQGTIAWTKTFLPLLLAVIAYYDDASYVTPAADFCLYLILSIHWSMTGPGRFERNARWIKWNKWI